MQMQIIINQLVKNVLNTTLYAVKKILSTVPGLNAIAFCVFALILGQLRPFVFCAQMSKLTQ